jgi:hypothetical protein
MVMQRIKNDFGYVITFNVTDSTGIPIDLSGATIVWRFRLKGSTTFVDGACVSASPTTGVCTYTVTATNFTTVGEYEAELKMTWGTSKKLSVKSDQIFIVNEIS